MSLCGNALEMGTLTEGKLSIILINFPSVLDVNDRPQTIYSLAFAPTIS